MQGYGAGAPGMEDPAAAAVAAANYGAFPLQATHTLCVFWLFLLARRTLLTRAG